MSAHHSAGPIQVPPERSDGPTIPSTETTDLVQNRLLQFFWILGKAQSRDLQALQVISWSGLQAVRTDGLVHCMGTPGPSSKASLVDSVKGMYTEF